MNSVQMFIKNTDYLNLTVSLCILIFLGNRNTALGQESISQSLTASIECRDFEKSKKLLHFLMDSLHTTTIKYHEGNSARKQGRKINATLETTNSGFEIFSIRIDKMGTVVNKNINRINNAAQVSGPQSELKFLNKQKNAYQKELDSLQRSAPEYASYWRQIREYESEIHKAERKIKENSNTSKRFQIILTLSEDIGTPQSNNNWSGAEFVNMPGGEYNLINIENPKPGFSASAYRGGGLKYLFTKGKSFVTFSVLKSVDAIADLDSSTYEEFFMYSFGQDFYPRHFGRGRRRFANLYTGYQVGGFFATSDTSSKNIMFVMPVVGLELFKSRYVVLDSKVGYFIPFYENRNMRGIFYHASFNFLF